MRRHDCECSTQEDHFQSLIKQAFAHGLNLLFWDPYPPVTVWTFKFLSVDTEEKTKAGKVLISLWRMF